MNPLETIITPGPGIPEMPLAENLPSPGAMVPESEQPDARVFVTEGGKIAAHLALWWSDVPPYPENKLGVAGGFAARDEEGAKALLDAACGHLAAQGCMLAVGPMNGNTWRSYRFVDESDGRPPFLLEPRNREFYPVWWRAAGFGELSSYSSSVMELDGSEAVPPALKERIIRSGITIRPLDTERYEEELATIHDLSLRSFTNNFLYTPLGRESFVSSYLKVKQHVDPQFARIAERDGVPCGFVFGIPDLEAAARGEQPAVIVKTLAVDPSSRSAGLGSLLVDELHRIARGKGYTEAIHALQHQTNTSLKITGRHEGRAFRRYVLFSKPL
ncbi:MAG: GNAT family N-acetyltransferase [Akkermansiaceae bacterium]|nr:GNAT family N-acetyltransferase [Akkermansiaceae bacterium]